MATVDLQNDGTVEKPINREAPMEELISSWITKHDHYDRNHGPIQHKLASEHDLTIDGLVATPLKITMEDLQTKYSQHKVPCALLCAGNRRHTMRTRIKEVAGIDWYDGAVMNCVWEGPRLRDVLMLAAGVHEVSAEAKEKQKHVQFASYGTKCQDDSYYGGSVPFERVMDPDMDVILALKMNGKPLCPRHGYPVRAIVPGVLGARSVKWLDRITVAEEESSNVYQKRDYKVLPPTVTDMDQAQQYWEKVPAMLEMPINACVAVPTYKSTVKLPDSGILEVKGYAVPQGHSGPVTRVEVSGDEGKTWVDAKLDYGPSELASKWTWVLWRASIKMEKGEGKKIFARATDRGGNTQDMEKSTWNLRGVGYNGYEAVYDLTVL